MAPAALETGERIDWANRLLGSLFLFSDRMWPMAGGEASGKGMGATWFRRASEAHVASRAFSSAREKDEKNLSANNNVEYALAA